MSFDQPEIKRCCFCFPLRYGLLVLTYLSLASSISYLCIVKIKKVYDDIKAGECKADDIIDLIFIFVDVVFNIIFVIAAHKKNAKLLKIALLVITSVAVLKTLKHVGLLVYYLLYVLTLVDFQHLTPKLKSSLKVFFWALLMDLSVIFVDIAINYYVYLMVLTEIKKLEKNRQFRFVNNATEAECKMELEGQYKIMDEGKTAEDMDKVDIEKGTKGDEEATFFNGTAKSEFTEDSKKDSMVNEEWLASDVDKNDL